MPYDRHYLIKGKKVEVTEEHSGAIKCKACGNVVGYNRGDLLRHIAKKHNG